QVPRCAAHRSSLLRLFLLSMRLSPTRRCRPCLLLVRPPTPPPTLFPYTTLFRSAEYIGVKHAVGVNSGTDALVIGIRAAGVESGDRKSTRLNSSHVSISYAVFRLKKINGTVHPGAAGPHSGLSWSDSSLHIVPHS